MTKDAFLPENYQIPEGESRYMKLIEGENRFRILGSAIVGHELWVEGSPLRKKDKSKFSPQELKKADINKFTGQKKTPQAFWAFPIYDYQTEQVKILEVTQVTIMRGMQDYLQDDDYGDDPKKYDFIVVRDESGEKTEYRVKAKPPKELDEGIMQMYKDMKIDLDQLFSGGDPFAPKGKEEVNPDDIPEELGK